MKRDFHPFAIRAIYFLRSGLCQVVASQVLAVGLVLATAGVQAQTSVNAPLGPKKPARAAQATALPLVDATVEHVLRDSGELVLDHGDLPNLAMPPMTMAFDVGNKKMLDAVKPGDKIRFQAEIVKGRPTITHLERARR
jgi:Cu(I)/Ag(I) efflux system membrane protein CusA/SilA